MHSSDSVLFVPAIDVVHRGALGKESQKLLNRRSTCPAATMERGKQNKSIQPSTSNISRRQLLKNNLLPLLLLPFAPLSTGIVSPALAAKEASSATAESTEKALQELREVTGLQDLAFEYTNKFDFPQAEILWTKIIGMNDKNAAAFSNRGNCRTSQGKFEEAVSDFNQAISLSPEEPDPYLGKGVALEGLKQYRQALEAYEKANEQSKLKYKTPDAVALNNMGNAYGGLGEWENAFTYYKKASDMDSRFVFALANESLALFQLGTDDDTAERKVMYLIRKYPNFADMHAANAMIKWERGDNSKAEDEWYKAVESDPRYENVSWVREFRRWPPRLLTILESFRSLSS